MRLCLHAAAVGCRAVAGRLPGGRLRGGDGCRVVDDALGCSEWGTVRGVRSPPRADRCGSFVRRGRATCRALAVAATVVELGFVRVGTEPVFGRCCGDWLCLEGRLRRMRWLVALFVGSGSIPDDPPRIALSGLGPIPMGARRPVCRWRMRLEWRSSHRSAGVGTGPGRCCPVRLHSEAARAVGYGLR